MSAAEQVDQRPTLAQLRDRAQVVKNQIKPGISRLNLILEDIDAIEKTLVQVESESRQ